MPLLCTGKYNQKLIGTGHPDGLTVLELRKIAKYFGINSSKREDICLELIGRMYTKEQILSAYLATSTAHLNSTPVIPKDQTNYISEYTLGKYEIKLPEIRKTTIPSYTWGYSPGKIDKSYNYQPSSFSQVNCGLTFNKWYRVQNILCTALAHEPLESFLNDKSCSVVGKAISTNLVRVASQRIFADPLRSLLEPISNSVDAYRKINGSPEIGKFGMGFFSILYWLTRPEDYIIIDSIHLTKEGRLCHWRSKILFYEGEYFFTLYDSYILLPESNLQTGTTITLFTSDNKFENLKLENAIDNAFGSLQDVTIITGTSKREGIVEGTFQTDANFLSVINNGVIRETIFVTHGNDYIQYHDLATGIDINTYITSMLIPTISTKPPPNNIGYRQSSRVRSGNNQLFITVGDITVLSIQDIPNYFSPFYYKTLNNIKRSDYILSLPSNTPMPVSRDDIVLEDSVFFEIARRELIYLLELSLLGGDVETLFRLMYIYSNKTNSQEIYKLVNIVREYIQNHPYIFLVPRGYDDVYSSITKALGGYFFIPSDLPDYDKLKRLVLSKFKNYDGYIQNHKVIPIKLKEKKVTDGGVSGLLFVDITLKDTYRILQEARPLILASKSESLPKEYTDILSSVSIKGSFIYDNIINLLGVIRVVEFKENLSQSLTHDLIIYSSNVITLATFFTLSKEFIDEYANLLYSMFIRIVNRTVSYNGNNKTAVYVNESPYIAGTYVYNKSKGIDTRNIDFRDKNVLNYLLNYANIFVNIMASNDKHVVTIRDPFSSYIFLYLSKLNNYREILNFIISIHPIYSYYFSLVYHDWYTDLENGKIDGLLLFNYVYYELSNRHSIATLIEAPSQIYKTDIAESENGIRNIMDSIRTSLDIYKDLVNGTLNKFIPPPIHNRLYETSFKGSQLINYLFRNDVNFDLVTWLFLVKDYPGISSNFKIYDIAINDGTTKSFATSVITELLQNSIDATRQNNFVSGVINLGIQEYDNKGIISMKDDIGIPLPGLISIMIPFLSTKTSKSELVTGEMGTGFMNVFRQPYTKSVEIFTTEPNNHHYFQLSITPIIIDSRVKDLQITFRVSESSWKEKGTVIAIQLNEMDKKEQSSILSEAQVFAKNNFPITSKCTGIPTSINEKRQDILFDTIKIYDNEYASAYITENEDIKSPSILLTNGIPFAELEGVSKMLWKSTFHWIEYVYPFGIYINLKKNNYKPVQSRKDIIMDEKDKDVLKALITLACIIRIFQRIDKGEKDNYFFPGLTYKGSMDQVMPEVIFGESGYNVGKNASESILENIGIKNSVSWIIRDIVNNLSLLNKSPSKKYIEEALEIHQPLPMYYQEAIISWFSGKTGKTIVKDAVVLGVGDGTQGVNVTQQSTVKFDPQKARNIMYLVDKMIKHVWNWGRKNLNLKLISPKIVYVDDLGSMAGVYEPSLHSIKISIVSLDIQKYDPAARTYLKLWKRDREKAITFLINNKELHSILGAQIVAPVIIHELGHAIFNTSHTGNAHGNLKFRIGKENFDFPFDKGCCEIWERALADFSPFE